MPCSSVYHLRQAVQLLKEDPSSAEFKVEELGEEVKAEEPGQESAVFTRLREITQTRLKSSLQLEGFWEQDSVKIMFELLQKTIDNEDIQGVKQTANQMIDSLCCFDIGRLRENFERYLSMADALTGEACWLLFGAVGSGRTTTMQYLLGLEMIKEDGSNHIHTRIPQKTTMNATLDLSKVSDLEIDEHESVVKLIDVPLSDDISNLGSAMGLSESLKKAKHVKLLVLFKNDDLKGPMYQGLKYLSSAMDNLIDKWDTFLQEHVGFLVSNAEESISELQLHKQFDDILDTSKLNEDIPEGIVWQLADGDTVFCPVRPLQPDLRKDLLQSLHQRVSAFKNPQSMMIDTIMNEDLIQRLIEQFDRYLQIIKNISIMNNNNNKNPMIHPNILELFCEYHNDLRFVIDKIIIKQQPSSSSSSIEKLIYPPTKILNDKMDTFENEMKEIFSKKMDIIFENNKDDHNIEDEEKKMDDDDGSSVTSKKLKYIKNMIKQLNIQFHKLFESSHSRDLCRLTIEDWFSQLSSMVDDEYNDSDIIDQIIDIQPWKSIIDKIDLLCKMKDEDEYFYSMMEFNRTCDTFLMSWQFSCDEQIQRLHYAKEKHECSKFTSICIKVEYLHRLYTVWREGDKSLLMRVNRLPKELEEYWQERLDWVSKTLIGCDSIMRMDEESKEEEKEEIKDDARIASMSDEDLVHNDDDNHDGSPLKKLKRALFLVLVSDEDWNKIDQFIMEMRQCYDKFKEYSKIPLINDPGSESGSVKPMFAIQSELAKMTLEYVKKMDNLLMEYPMKFTDSLLHISNQSLKGSEKERVNQMKDLLQNGFRMLDRFSRMKCIENIIKKEDHMIEQCRLKISSLWKGKMNHLISGPLLFMNEQLRLSDDLENNLFERIDPENHHKLMLLTSLDWEKFTQQMKALNTQKKSLKNKESMGELKELIIRWLNVIFKDYWEQCIVLRQTDPPKGRPRIFDELVLDIYVRNLLLLLKHLAQISGWLIGKKEILRLYRDIMNQVRNVIDYYQSEFDVFYSIKKEKESIHLWIDMYNTLVISFSDLKEKLSNCDGDLERGIIQPMKESILIKKMRMIEMNDSDDFVEIKPVSVPGFGEYHDSSADENGSDSDSDDAKAQEEKKDDSSELYKTRMMIEKSSDEELKAQQKADLQREELIVEGLEQFAATERGIWEEGFVSMDDLILYRSNPQRAYDRLRQLDQDFQSGMYRNLNTPDYELSLKSLRYLSVCLSLPWNKKLSGFDIIEHANQTIKVICKYLSVYGSQWTVKFSDLAAEVLLKLPKMNANVTVYDDSLKSIPKEGRRKKSSDELKIAGEDDDSGKLLFLIDGDDEEKEKEAIELGLNTRSLMKLITLLKELKQLYCMPAILKDGRHLSCVVFTTKNKDEMIENVLRRIHGHQQTLAKQGRETKDVSLGKYFAKLSPLDDHFISWAKDTLDLSLYCCQSYNELSQDLLKMAKDDLNKKLLLAKSRITLGNIKGVNEILRNLDWSSIIKMNDDENEDDHRNIQVLKDIRQGIADYLKKKILLTMDEIKQCDLLICYQISDKKNYRINNEINQLFHSMIEFSDAWYSLHLYIEDELDYKQHILLELCDLRLLMQTLFKEKIILLNDELIKKEENYEYQNAELLLEKMEMIEHYLLSSADKVLDSDTVKYICHLSKQLHLRMQSSINDLIQDFAELDFAWIRQDQRTKLMENCDIPKLKLNLLKIDLESYPQYVGVWDDIKGHLDKAFERILSRLQGKDKEESSDHDYNSNDDDNSDDDSAKLIDSDDGYDDDIYQRFGISSTTTSSGLSRASRLRLAAKRKKRLSRRPLNPWRKKRILNLCKEFLWLLTPEIRDEWMPLFEDVVIVDRLGGFSAADSSSDVLINSKSLKFGSGDEKKSSLVLTSSLIGRSSSSLSAAKKPFDSVLKSEDEVIDIHESDDDDEDDEDEDTSDSASGIGLMKGSLQRFNEESEEKQGFEVEQLLVDRHHDSDSSQEPLVDKAADLSVSPALLPDESHDVCKAVELSLFDLSKPPPTSSSSSSSFSSKLIRSDDSGLIDIDIDDLELVIIRKGMMSEDTSSELLWSDTFLGVFPGYEEEEEKGGSGDGPLKRIGDSFTLKSFRNGNLKQCRIQFQRCVNELESIPEKDRTKVINSTLQSLNKIIESDAIKDDTLMKCSIYRIEEKKMKKLRDPSEIFEKLSEYYQIVLMVRLKSK